MSSKVGIPLPTWVYVLVDDREAFDLLARPVTDHRPDKNLLTKTVGEEGVTVIFQHWLAEPASVGGQS